MRSIRAGRIGAALLFVLAPVLILASPAWATVTCGIDGDTLFIKSDASETIEVSRDGVGNILVAGCDPAGAVVSKTAVISVEPDPNEQHLLVDLTGGDFGSTDWTVDTGDGSDTLEVRAGSDGSSIDAGANGIDLDGNADLDIAYTNVESLVLVGGPGADSLNAGPSDITGQATTIPVDLQGGDGNDTLVGGGANDRLDGGAGVDTLDGGGGSNTCINVDGDALTNCSGPVISSLEPDHGWTTGNQTVLIHGTGFTSTDTVRFGGTPVTVISSTSTQLEVRTPAVDTAAVVQVVVQRSNGHHSKPVRFIYDVPPSAERPWAATIPAPGHVPWNPKALAVSLAIAGFLLILIPFPSELFNKTLEDHKDVVARWFGRSRARPPARRARRIVAFALAILVTAFLTSYLDPSFGADAESVATYLGFVVALIFITLVFGVATVLYMHRHLRNTPNEHGRLDPFLWGVPIAATCVVISRLVHFQPGYLYGAIAGISFAAIDSEREGLREAWSSTWILVLTIAIWFARVPVAGKAGQAGEPLFGQMLDVALTAIFIAGVEYLAFGLLPIKPFPGRHLREWSKPIWAGLFALGIVGFVYLIAYPNTNYRSNGAIIPTILLFVGFGLASIGLATFFRMYDRRRSVADEAGHDRGPSI